MTNTLDACSFQPVEPPVHTPTKPDFSPPKEVKTQWELMRRLGNFTELDLGGMGAGVDQYWALLRTVDRNVFEQIAAKNLMIDPKSGTRYQQWLARHFPSMASSKQSPKQIRDSLRRAQMAGESIPDILPFYADSLEDGFAKFFGMKAMENMVTEVNTMLTQNGVRMSKQKRGQLMQHLLEVGQLERNINTATLGPNGVKTAQREAMKAEERVLNMGISEEGVDQLLKIIDQGRTALDELYVLANAYGVPTEALENIGYFPRVFSEDAKFVVRSTDKEVLSRWADNPNLGLEAAFQKSRQTDNFIVEDEVIIAHALGLIDKDVITQQKSLLKTIKTTDGEALSEAQEQLESLIAGAREKLAPMLVDENTLKRELVNLPDDTLNTLVDSGVLSKLPMTSEQFFDFFKQKYSTGYKHIDELMVTDPIRAYDARVNQLKQQLGKSVMTQGMYRDAVKNGWGVSSGTRMSNMAEYGDYIKLDENVLKKFGVTENVPGAANVYLHPQVVDQYTAIMEVATDPFTMGTFSSVWQYANRLFKNQALGTTGMLGRQVYQLFMSSVMGGTNLAHIVPDLYKYVQFNKLGYDAYDNTKRIFANGTMTEREMIVRLVERGEIGPGIAANIAGSGGFKANEAYSALNPANAARALGYWKSVIDGQGLFPKITDGKVKWDAVEYGGGLLYRFSAEQSGRLMSAAVFLENAFKIAHYRSTLRDGGANMVGQFATNGKRYHFQTIEDAVSHAHNYFFDYSDVGLGDKLFKSNLIPFWVYQSRNVPAQVRNAMRNPAQFMAYQRLYALINKDARESGEDAPEGGFAPWMQGFGQSYFKHPTKKDTWFNIPFTSFDPIADATKTIVGVNNSMERAFGYYPGNFRDKLKQSDPKNQTLPFIDLLMEQSGGPLKAILATASGRDSLGRSLKQRPGKTTSLLGVEIPGENAPLVKFLIENALPSVSQLNQFNPGELFGVREKKDAMGNVTRQAQPSLFGAARSDSDADVDESRGEFGWVSLLRASGITVNTVDTARNMQFTETELSFAAKDMKDYAKQLKSALKKEPQGTDKHNKLYQQYVTALAMAKEIEEGRKSSEDWLSKRGYKPQFERGSGRRGSKDYGTANAALKQLRGR